MVNIHNITLVNVHIFQLSRKGVLPWKEGPFHATTFTLLRITVTGPQWAAFSFIEAHLATLSSTALKLYGVSLSCSYNHPKEIFILAGILGFKLICVWIDIWISCISSFISRELSINHFYRVATILVSYELFSCSLIKLPL